MKENSLSPNNRKFAFFEGSPSFNPWQQRTWSMIHILRCNIQIPKYRHYWHLWRRIWCCHKNHNDKSGNIMNASPAFRWERQWLYLPQKTNTAPRFSKYRTQKYKIQRKNNKERMRIPRQSAHKTLRHKEHMEQRQRKGEPQKSK